MREGKSKAGENILLILNNDIERDKHLKYKLREQNEKFNKMLLFSSIFGNWSYLGQILTTTRSYLIFNGKHFILLVSLMLGICLITDFVIYLVWKIAAFRRTHPYFTYQVYLTSQLSKLLTQLKLAVLYLAGYTSLLGISLFFFSMEPKNEIFHLLKLTAASAFITYGLWFFVIIKSCRQINSLKVILLENNTLYLNEINQN